MIWGGIVLYITYTFVIYCFAIHFNNLFVVYCLCLGLSFYSLVYFLFTLNSERKKAGFENKTAFHFIGFYFIIISMLFYFLWLSEIIPAIFQNTVPGSVVEAGLFTNAVHVIDLSVILPAIFITGVLLLKRKPIGIFLTPVLLTFFVLMNITIGILVVITRTKGRRAPMQKGGAMAALTSVRAAWCYAGAVASAGAAAFSITGPESLPFASTSRSTNSITATGALSP